LLIFVSNDYIDVMQVRDFRETLRYEDSVERVSLLSKQPKIGTVKVVLSKGANFPVPPPSFSLYVPSSLAIVMSPHDTFQRLDSHLASRWEAPYLRVLLHVNGIHCPSCVSYITKLLQSLDASINPSSISVSYLDHTVLFQLPIQQQSIGNAQLEQEHKEVLTRVIASLKGEGYVANAIECKVVWNSMNKQDSSHVRTVVPFELAEADPADAILTEGLPQEQEWSLWYSILHPRQVALRKEAKRERERRWKRHLQVCSSCREGQHEPTDTVIKQQQSSDTSINSMSGEEAPTITWQASYSVGGMTCASCVSNVEKAVKASEVDLTSFSVALMQGSAIARFVTSTSEEAHKRAGLIGEAVEDAGYDCSLEQVLQQGKKKEEARTVRVRVDGMFCLHCLKKVQSYIQGNPHLQAEERDWVTFTLAGPTLAVTYIPTSTTTVRSILADIEALDPAFQTSISIPPSISSRSALHARKELYSLLVRLVFAFLFVPPTLLIAVIVPTFLSQSHPLRISTSHQIIGQATKGDIILWALATPVQFLIGQVFYTRAFKSLRSVWRKGRSWKDRLISWGDMNVLVALGTSVAYFASLAFLIVDMTREASSSAMEANGNMTYFDACVFLICE
jgi:cation transport ATPase